MLWSRRPPRVQAVPPSRPQTCFTRRGVPARAAISPKNNQSKSSVDHWVPLARLCVDWRERKKSAKALQTTLQSNKGGAIRQLESRETLGLQVIYVRGLIVQYCVCLQSFQYIMRFFVGARVCDIAEVSLSPLENETFFFPFFWRYVWRFQMINLPAAMLITLCQSETNGG